MAPTEQIEVLVDRLRSLTQDGKVDWRDTADEEAFQVAFPKYVVTIHKSDDNFHLKVADKSGRTLEEATDGGLDSQLRQKLRPLHESARRRALHVDEALSDLLAFLLSIS